MAGSFVSTLVLTDIASGWTDCVPLPVQEAQTGRRRGRSASRRTSLSAPGDRHRQRHRVPQRGVGRLLQGASDRADTVQAVSEERLGRGSNRRTGVVRRLVGYGRLEGVRAAEALARLYSAARLFVSVFQPSFKLAEKTGKGAPVRKRYHTPEAPCARLLAADAIPAVMKDKMRAVLGTVAPLGLLDENRAAQHHLAGLAAGATVHPMPQRDADLDGFQVRSRIVGWPCYYCAWSSPEPPYSHQFVGRRPGTDPADYVGDSAHFKRATCCRLVSMRSFAKARVIRWRFRIALLWRLQNK